MNAATQLMNRWMGVDEPTPQDGSYQPHLEWYGPFLSVQDRYGPFLPNVKDTVIMASYVNENESKGLKSISEKVLGYQQTTYDQVTIKTMARRDWDGKGRLLSTGTDDITNGFDDDGNPVVVGHIDTVTVQRKMNQLSAGEVFNYGADDTICTAAFANFGLMVLELEGTDEIYDQVETYPAYLTAQGYVSGVDFSHESMRAQESDDDKAYDEAWKIVRDYLIKVGFDGTVTPTVVTSDEYKVHCETKGVKEDDDYIPFSLAGMGRIVKIVLGEEYLQHEGVRVKARTPAKWGKALADRHDLLSKAVSESRLDIINDIVSRAYDGEPVLDLGSPPQAARLLYDIMGLPVNIVNEATDLEKKFNQPLVKALYAHRNWRVGKGPEPSADQKALIRKKAKADDDAIKFAIAFDVGVVTDEIKSVLKAYGTMKAVYTRRNLFYRNYWPIKHWRTKKIHSSMNQCAAVTRRYSSSNPNFQQLPKKGEAIRFRRHFVPHKKNAVICSIDFSGQELRLAADISGDANMLSCYVGDNLKDIHSITASGAMKLKWSEGVVQHYLDTLGQGITNDEEGLYRLFMLLLKGNETPEKIKKMASDLRKDSKSVNFAAQFGGQALKLSETLIMPVADAQLFLTARSKMFPMVDVMAKEKQDEAMRLGYARTLMGARRHLAHAINSPNRQEASRAARQAWNMWIQGSAAEMTKLAMTRFWLSGAIYRFDARFFGPIHDELVTSVAKEHAEQFIRIKHWCMTQPYATMKVPVLGSISFGENFADQIECGDDYDEQSITDAKLAIDQARVKSMSGQDTFSIIRESRNLGLDPQVGIDTLESVVVQQKLAFKDAIAALKEKARATT